MAVLKDLLASTVTSLRTSRMWSRRFRRPRSGITFNVKEGPTVKVGKIAFQGNNNISDRTLRDAMVNTKPIGIPHSIILENLFARTFDASKLDEDTERVRRAYAGPRLLQGGDLRGRDPCARCGRDQLVHAAALDRQAHRHSDAGGRGRALQAGRHYLHRQQGGAEHPGAARAVRAEGRRVLQRDDVRQRAGSAAQGVRRVRASSTWWPTRCRSSTRRRSSSTWNIDIDEGKPFYVSRIEFTGNTITRDKVIRRELLLEEGQIYSSQLWDLSILRLNQLSYFEPLKAEQDSETRQNAEEHTVDLLLKLKEKGKNSIGVNGGISGLSGTFIGLNYETNNFLGLGETLSVNANIGDLSRNLSFGFNEPYLRNKPISLGVEVFTRKYDYNPAKAYSISNNTPAEPVATRSSRC